jgi:plastocyanin
MVGASEQSAGFLPAVLEILRRIPLRESLRIGLLITATLLPAANASAQGANPPQAPGENVQVIEMIARKYEFSPSPVHVKKGARVQLKIRAIDREHGFKINVYPDRADTKEPPGLVFTSHQDCWKLEKGQVTVIEFVANEAGSYPFKCCHFCGFGHMGMKGQLIVDP